MTTCTQPWPAWWCSRKAGHPGPCALRPKWWNLSRFARLVRR